MVVKKLMTGENTAFSLFLWMLLSEEKRQGLETGKETTEDEMSKRECITNIKEIQALPVNCLFSYQSTFLSKYLATFLLLACIPPHIFRLYFISTPIRTELVTAHYI